MISEEEKEALRAANPLEEVLPALTGYEIEERDAQTVCLCPFHDDHNPSLRINVREQLYYCDVCAKGGDVFHLIEQLEDTDFAGACEWLRERAAGVVSSRPANATSAGASTGGGEDQAIYDYQDLTGQTVYQVCRLKPKAFFMRRLDGRGGWIKNIEGLRRVLYRLPKLAGHKVAVVVEGEKDADRLAKAGLPATTNAGGAGKWEDRFVEQLRMVGVQGVIVLPDADEAGRRHAATVVRSCMAGGLVSKIVELPGLPEKGDVSDWLDAGHTLEELIKAITSAPVLTNPPGSGCALSFTTLGALMREPAEERRWLVEGLLPASGLSLLAGKPKVGKSTALRHLALCVATGQPWLGRPCAKGRVLYLALEEKRDEVIEHFRTMGATEDDEIRFFFGVGSKELAAFLERECRREPPALVVVDPLQRFLRVRDGNDYGSMSLAFDPVLSLARSSSAHFMLAHHMRKRESCDADAVLGSTAIFGSVDTAVLLAQKGTQRVISSRQRYGEDLAEHVLDLDPLTRRLSLGFERCESAALQVEERIVAFLRSATRPVSEPEIERQVEGKTLDFRAALRKLVSAKLVVRIGAGVKGNPYRYELPPAEQSAGGRCHPNVWETSFDEAEGLEGEQGNEKSGRG